MTTAGRLSIVGTPIGNLDDLSPRAARTLAEADVIACEDTRVARVLLSRVREVAGPTDARLISTNAHNEESRIEDLLQRLVDGAHVALTTDAGMPVISDPGARLIAACAEAGIPIEVIPGPSAVVAAIAVAGIPAARFCFEGFLPRTSGKRARRLREMAADDRAQVFYESPHRIGATLAAMVEAFGADREGAVCRELTKRFEEVARGPLSVLAERFADGARGEFTIVVAGAPAAPSRTAHVDRYAP